MTGAITMKELRRLFLALGIFAVLVCWSKDKLPSSIPDGFWGFVLICIPIGIIGMIWEIISEICGDDKKDHGDK